MNHKKGFTLIELLVVVAIIGILASVILANLNAARDKATDAAIKANLANARPQAGIYYDDNSQSYAGACAALSGVSGQVTGAAIRLLGGVGSPNIGDNSKAFSYDPTGINDGNSVCHDSADAWAAIVSLKQPVTDTAAGWCVDSTGASKETTLLDPDITACP